MGFAVLVLLVVAAVAFTRFATTTAHEARLRSHARDAAPPGGVVEPDGDGRDIGRGGPGGGRS
ncbi:MAG: hypothetical protein ACTHMS_08805 [Jatrophihabitans sp.]|uniref:hypothetical protein n=1 Tax=Jatrophihabitans sp. TaxID=1932789 RepID=UPI003F7F8E71